MIDVLRPQLAGALMAAILVFAVFAQFLREGPYALSPAGWAGPLVLAGLVIVLRLLVGAPPRKRRLEGVAVTLLDRVAVVLAGALGGFFGFSIGVYLVGVGPLAAAWAVIGVMLGAGGVALAGRDSAEF